MSNSVEWYEDPVYIKMCGQAEEVQKQRKDNQSHQFFCCRICGNIACEDTGSYWVDCDCTVTNTELIWLPRQDQLQELVVFPDQPYYQIGRFSRVIGDWCKEGYLAHGASMEQLWLAFVMKEKYNKVWNGEVWNEDIQDLL